MDKFEHIEYFDMLNNLGNINLNDDPDMENGTENELENMKDINLLDMEVNIEGENTEIDYGIPNRNSPNAKFDDEDFIYQHFNLVNTQNELVLNHQNILSVIDILLVHNHEIVGNYFLSNLRKVYSTSIDSNPDSGIVLELLEIVNAICDYIYADILDKQDITYYRELAKTNARYEDYIGISLIIFYIRHMSKSFVNNRMIVIKPHMIQKLNRLYHNLCISVLSIISYNNEYIPYLCLQIYGE